MDWLGLALLAFTVCLCGLLVLVVVRAIWVRRVRCLLAQLSKVQGSLEEAVHIDSLTHLINRRGFLDAVTRQLDEHPSAALQRAVLFLDVDHFKRINDSLGHEVGDQLLEAIAALLKRRLPANTLIGRLGGDEFCVLLSGSRDYAQGWASQLLHMLREPIDIAGRRMVMTTSIGISLFPQDGNNAAVLLDNADLALYQSKESGRNCANFFNSDLRLRAMLQLQLEEQLRSALLAGSGLEVFYQPIYDLPSGQLAKLEALVRWRHPQHGLLSPDRFIGIAEANGLIAALDGWVLRQACADLAQLTRNDMQQLKITVNCSALSLSRDELAEEIAAALNDAGIQPDRLELEITENALMDNIEATANLLHRIRAMGVSLSIDDFGTGYSSLAYLKRLPLNTLKIDRSFIQEVPRSQRDMEIVQAIIVMAHSLQMKVVTEGVESTAQHRFLKACGCDYVQGYLLGRPMPLVELRASIDSHRLNQTQLPAQHN